MNRGLAALALAGLYIMTSASSCATTGGREAPAKPVYIHDEVSVACVPADMPATPAATPPTKAALAALADDAARYQALAEFWTGWSPWIAVAVPVLDNCRKAAPPPAAVKPEH